MIVSRAIWTLSLLVLSTWADPEFQVLVNPYGAYTISIRGSHWLQSSATFFQLRGHRCDTSTGCMKLTNESSSSGSDIHGDWTLRTLLYDASGVALAVSFKIYQAGFVIFEQEYINGALGTDTGNPNNIIGGFPNFRIGSQDQGINLGYLNYGGMMLGDTTSWDAETMNIRDGIAGGPLALFDHDGHVIIMSPFNNFMAASSMHMGMIGGDIGWGIMGRINNIPRGFKYQTIMFYSSGGINQAFEDWGAVMRTQYGRTEEFMDTDLSLTHLGYWTDNGTYYYYRTETGKNYEDTMLDVVSYAKEMNIPYKYIQFDSWRYPQGPDPGPGGGSMDWSAKPDVFPHGMMYLYNHTRLPSVAHNRWWSSKTPYAKQNGGQFDFVVEVFKSIPDDQHFWDSLLKKSKEWGLITYEQDWLNVQFLGLNAFQTDLDLGRRWLTQMGEGARKNRLTLQYCMANPRHALQALEINTVTQARVTDDYEPGMGGWKVGITSIFAHALRIAPYKDAFWTTTNQTQTMGGPFEFHPELNALISVLTTGPVGPGDRIGMTNVSMLMRCCNTDGLILKPSNPAKAIDNQILQSAFGDGSGPDGDVYSAVTVLSGLYFANILAADLAPNTKYQLWRKQAMLPRTQSGYRVWRDAVSPVSSALVLQDFDENTPLTLEGCSTAHFCHYHVSPVISLGNREVVLMGELTKFVPMSPKRITSITQTNDDIIINILGIKGEHVEFWFSVEGKVNYIACSLTEIFGKATISIDNMTCKSSLM